MKNLKKWQERYRQLLASMGGRAKTIGFDWLIRQYRQPHRHYHSFEHIQDCIALFDEHAGYFQQPAACEFALWAHDIIYRPFKKDNEERSAAWSKSVLHEAGVPNVVQEKVFRLVLATKHHAIADSLDEQLVLDIDLSILGRSKQVFIRYDEQIRKEYRWVPQKTYFAKRALILTSFLRWPHIYQSQPFQQRFESQARRNIREWLAEHGIEGPLNA